MTATFKDIEGWLDEAKQKDATHMIVVTDSWSHENFPHYVMPGEDPADFEPGKTYYVEECYAPCETCMEGADSDGYDRGLDEGRAEAGK